MQLSVAVVYIYLMSSDDSSRLICYLPLFLPGAHQGGHSNSTQSYNRCNARWATTTKVNIWDCYQHTWHRHCHYSVLSINKKPDHNRESYAHRNVQCTQQFSLLAKCYILTYCVFSLLSFKFQLQLVIFSGRSLCSLTIVHYLALLTRIDVVNGCYCFKQA